MKRAKKKEGVPVNPVVCVQPCPTAVSGCASAGVAAPLWCWRWLVLAVALLVSQPSSADLKLSPGSANLISTERQPSGEYIEGSAQFRAEFEDGDTIRSIALCVPDCAREDSEFIVSQGQNAVASNDAWTISHACRQPDGSGIERVDTDFFDDIGLCEIDVAYVGDSEDPVKAQLRVAANIEEVEHFSLDIQLADLLARTVVENDTIVELPAYVSFVQSSYDTQEGQLLQIAVSREDSGYSESSASRISFTASAAGDDSCCTEDAGTATEGEDFTFPNGKILEWEDGEYSTKLLDVRILDDEPIEGTESFSVEIDRSSLGDDVLGQLGSVTVRIEDQSVLERSSIEFSPSVLSGREGDELVFSVTRSGSAQSLDSYTSITLQQPDNLANDILINSEDLVGLYWDSGDTSSRTVRVTLLADVLEEGEERGDITAAIEEGSYFDESVVFRYSEPIPVIITDDPPARGSVGFASTAERVPESDQSVVLVVVREGGADGAGSVGYVISPGSAELGADYSLVEGGSVEGRLEWLGEDAGDREIEIVIEADEVAFEGDEEFTVTLIEPDGVSLSAASTATVVIEDTTVPPLAVGTIALQDSQLQLAEGAGEISVQVQRTEGADGEVSVAYAFEDVSAQNGQDYTGTNGRLVWASGDSEAKAIPLSIFSDTQPEGTEQFRIRLSDPRSPEGTTLAVSIDEMLVSITDDSEAGQIRFEAASGSVLESAGEYVIGVERFNGSDGAMSVDYQVVGVEAAPTTDFETVQGTLSWASGVQGRQAITVPLVVDSALESNETFIIRLSNLVSDAAVELSDTDHTVTINDDSRPPVGVVSFVGDSERAVQEGDQLVVLVQRTGGTAGVVSVQVDSFNDSAQADEDFEAISTELLWNDGEAGEKRLLINTLNDFIPEGDEQFVLRLVSADPEGVIQGTSIVNVTLRDNQGNPGVLSFVNAQTSIAEDADEVVLQVQRTGGSDGLVRVDYATISDTAGTEDFGASSGTLEWDDGASDVKEIRISINADSDNDESTEQFFVELSGATPVGDAEQLQSPARATVAITNVVVEVPMEDGGTIAMQSAALSVSEDEASVSIPVERQRGTAGRVSVDYQVQGDTATAGEDFTASSGTLTWPAGDNSVRTIVVDILGDFQVEETETFNVTLGSPRASADNIQVSSGASTSVVSIVDSTNPGTLRLIADGSGAGIIETAQTFSVQVERFGGSDGAVSVDYELEGGSGATAATVGSASDADVRVTGGSSAVRGTLNWSNGEEGSKPIELTIVNDQLEEPNESFTIRLINPQPGGLIDGAQSADFTIVDDDATSADTSYALVSGSVTEYAGVPGQSISGLSVQLGEGNESAIGRTVEWRVVPAGAVVFNQGSPAEFGAITTIDDTGQASMDIQIVSRGFIQIIASPENVASAESPRDRTPTARADPQRVQVSDSEVLFVLRSGFQSSEGLTDNQQATGRSLDGACERLFNSADDEALSAGQLDLKATCEQLQGLEDEGNTQALSRALDRLAPEEVFYIADAAIDAAQIQSSNIYSRINVLRSDRLLRKSLDVSALSLDIRGEVIPGSVVDSAIGQWYGGGGASDDALGLGSRLGMFASGELSMGKVDGNGEQRDTDLSTSGLTIGADYRVDRNIVAGVALGMVSSDADFTGDEGEGSSTGVSVSLFGSWYEQDTGYADAVLEFGQYSYDIQRRIDLPGSGQSARFANASTDSGLVSFSMSAGRNFNTAGWDLGPYIELSLINASVDGYSETLGSAGTQGVGSLLDVGSHSVVSTRFALGAQASRAFSTRRAVILPQLRVELEAESEDQAESISAVFQNDDTKTPLIVQGNERDSRYMNIGVGSSFVFANGKSAYLFYETRAQHDFVTRNSIKLGVRWEF